MDFKNRLPMYEGDGYIRPSPVQFPSEVPSQSENHVHRARQDSPKPRKGGLRALLSRVADWLERALRHPRRRITSRVHRTSRTWNAACSASSAAADSSPADPETLSPAPAAPGGRRSAGAKHRALLNLPRSHRKARTTWR